MLQWKHKLAPFVLLAAVLVASLGGFVGRGEFSNFTW